MSSLLADYFAMTLNFYSVIYIILLEMFYHGYWLHLSSKNDFSGHNSDEVLRRRIYGNSV
jgi:hypothetical protein